MPEKAIKQLKATREGGEAEVTAGARRPRTLPGRQLRVLARPPEGAAPSAGPSRPGPSPPPQRGTPSPAGARSTPAAGNGWRPGAAQSTPRSTSHPGSRAGQREEAARSCADPRAAPTPPRGAPCLAAPGGGPDSPRGALRAAGPAPAAPAAAELSLLRGCRGLSSTSRSGSRGASRDPGGGERRRRRRAG